MIVRHIVYSVVPTLQWLSTTIVFISQYAPRSWKKTSKPKIVNTFDWFIVLCHIDIYRVFASPPGELFRSAAHFPIAMRTPQTPSCAHLREYGIGNLPRSMGKIPTKSAVAQLLITGHNTCRWIVQVLMSKFSKNPSRNQPPVRWRFSFDENESEDDPR